MRRVSEDLRSGGPERASLSDQHLEDLREMALGLHHLVMFERRIRPDVPLGFQPTERDPELTPLRVSSVCTRPRSPPIDGRVVR